MEYNELVTTNEGPLSDAEEKELQECEAIIEAGLQEFVKVGNALLRVRDHKLYRAKYGTFEAYLKERWDISRRRGYQLLDAAEAVQNLSVGQCEPEVHIVPADEKNVMKTTEPTSEKQVRPLTGLSKDQQQEAWQEATETAKDPGKPTEAEVQTAVETVKAKQSTQDQLKASEQQIVEYLKKVGHDGATSEQIETDTGVAHQRVSELLTKGTAVYQTVDGKRQRRTTSGKHKGYVIVLAEFAEADLPSKETEIAVKTGQPAKPETHVPTQLLGQGQIITGDQLARGHAVSTDVAGESCSLPIGVSKLERDETVAFTMAGSEGFKDRKGYYKWQRYRTKKIRDKVLKVLELMSPLEMPKGHKVPAVTYQYNLEVACDLQELVEMLCADLSRQASAMKNKEKYGHLYAKANCEQ